MTIPETDMNVKITFSFIFFQKFTKLLNMFLTDVISGRGAPLVRTMTLRLMALGSLFKVNEANMEAPSK